MVADKQFKEFEANTRHELGQLQARLNEQAEDFKEEKRILTNKINILKRETELYEHKINELEIERAAYQNVNLDDDFTPSHTAIAPNIVKEKGVEDQGEVVLPEASLTTRSTIPTFPAKIPITAAILSPVQRENAKIIKALNAFGKHRKSDQVISETKGKVYDGKYVIIKCITAKHQRHVIFEAIDKYSGERKWIRYVWMHPVHPRLTLREFYLLRNFKLSCLPKLEHITEDGPYFIAVYQGLSHPSHTLTKELQPKTKQTTQGDVKQYLSTFRLCQLSQAIMDAVLELQKAGLYLLDLRPENIWIGNRDTPSEDLDDNLRKYVRGNKAISKSIILDGNSGKDGNGRSTDPLLLDDSLGRFVRESLLGEKPVIEGEDGEGAAGDEDRGSKSINMGGAGGEGAAARKSTRKSQRAPPPGAAGGGAAAPSFADEVPRKKEPIVVFLELENLCCNSEAREKLHLPGAMLYAIPMFRNFYMLPDALDAGKIGWADVHLWKTAELGHFTHLELLKFGIKGRVLRAWGESPTRRSDGAGKQESLIDIVAGVKTEDKQDGRNSSKDASTKGIEKKGNESMGGADINELTGDKSMGGADMSMGGAGIRASISPDKSIRNQRYPDKGPRNSSMSPDRSNQMNGRVPMGRVNSDCEPYPLNANIMLQAQNFALAKTLILLCQAVSPDIAIAHAGADGASGGLQNIKKAQQNIRRDKNQDDLVRQGTITMGNSINSPTKKSTEHAHLLGTNGGKDDVILMSPQKTQDGNLGQIQDLVAMEATVQGKAMNEPVRLQSLIGDPDDNDEHLDPNMSTLGGGNSPDNSPNDGLGHGSAAPNPVLNPVESVGLIGQDEISSGNNRPAYGLEGSVKVQTHAVAQSTNSVQGFGGNINIDNMDDYMDNESDNNFDSLPPNPINGTIADMLSASIAAETGTGNSPSPKRKKVKKTKFDAVYINGIAISPNYAKFYHYWQKWISGGMSTEGTTLENLKNALYDSKATEQIYERNSTYGVLDKVIPSLFSKNGGNGYGGNTGLASGINDPFSSPKKKYAENPQNHTDLESLCNKFRERVDLSKIELNFYTIPRNMSDPLWDCSHLALTSAHIWRVLETLPKLEFRTKLRIRKLAAKPVDSLSDKSFNPGPISPIKLQRQAKPGHANSLEVSAFCNYFLKNPNANKLLLVKQKSQSGGESASLVDFRGVDVTKCLMPEDLSVSKPRGLLPGGGSLMSGGAVAVGGAGAVIPPPSGSGGAVGTGVVGGLGQKSGKEYLSPPSGCECIILPRAQKTVVDWEMDAVRNNTGRIYLSLCNYLVISGKLSNIPQAITSMSLDFPKSNNSRLQFLVLKGLKFLDQGGMSFLNLIHEGSPLEYLDLSDNCLSDLFLTKFCGDKCLQKMRRLKVLLLRSNAISHVGVQQLMLELGMTQNGTPLVPGLQSQGSTGSQVLSRGTLIKSEAMNAIADEEDPIVCSLEVLDLSENCCAGSGEYIYRAFTTKKLPPVRVLNLASNGLTSNDAKSLSNLMNELHKRGKNLACITGTPVSRKQNFLTLNVEHNCIGREGITSLIKTAKKGRINVGNNGLTRESVEGIVKDESSSNSSNIISNIILQPATWSYDVEEPRVKISYIDPIDNKASVGMAGQEESASLDYLEIYCASGIIPKDVKVVEGEGDTAESSG